MAQRFTALARKAMQIVNFVVIVWEAKSEQ